MIRNMLSVTVAFSIALSTESAEVQPQIDVAQPPYVVRMLELTKIHAIEQLARRYASDLDIKLQDKVLTKAAAEVAFKNAQGRNSILALQIEWSAIKESPHFYYVEDQIDKRNGSLLIIAKDTAIVKVCFRPKESSVISYLELKFSKNTSAESIEPIKAQFEHNITTIQDAQKAFNEVVKSNNNELVERDKNNNESSEWWKVEWSEIRESEHYYYVEAMGFQLSPVLYIRKGSNVARCLAVQ